MGWIWEGTKSLGQVSGGGLFQPAVGAAWVLADCLVSWRFRIGTVSGKVSAIVEKTEGGWRAKKKRKKSASRGHEKGTGAVDSCFGLFFLVPCGSLSLDLSSARLAALG